MITFRKLVSKIPSGVFAPIILIAITVTVVGLQLEVSKLNTELREVRKQPTYCREQQLKNLEVSRLKAELKHSEYELQYCRNHLLKDDEGYFCGYNGYIYKYSHDDNIYTPEPVELPIGSRLVEE